MLGRQNSKSIRVDRHSDNSEDEGGKYAEIQKRRVGRQSSESVVVSKVARMG